MAGHQRKSIRRSLTLDLAMGSRMRDLAAGRAYRLDRRDLPPGHPARRQGDLGDALILTEDNLVLIEDA